MGNYEVNGNWGPENETRKLETSTDWSRILELILLGLILWRIW